MKPETLREHIEALRAQYVKRGLVSDADWLGDILDKTSRLDALERAVLGAVQACAEGDGFTGPRLTDLLCAWDALDRYRCSR